MKKTFSINKLLNNESNKIKYKLNSINVDLMDKM